MKRCYLFAQIGTGFSDEQLDDIFASLSQTVIAERPDEYTVGDTVRLCALLLCSFLAVQDMPDVWLKPSTVWEVNAAELSLSPKYCAGLHEVLQRFD